MEHGEEPVEALRREVLEEIGVDIGAIEGPPRLELSDPGTGFELSVWVVDRWDGLVQNLQREEHDDLGWFRLGNLDDVTLADKAYRSFLEEILQE